MLVNYPRSRACKCYIKWRRDGHFNCQIPQRHGLIIIMASQVDKRHKPGVAITIGIATKAIKVIEKKSRKKCSIKIATEKV